ncbi:phosphodiester glycosidase family protein [Qipengyuania sediminis]|uniref:phosphodiester glycosidase family protein n=1 Tax=Qipengyuania sediminis TaxID=1532023 RepID=UPI0010599482|nr:phosphodiester glycosidase family protein [Qipengyuania sediminis]
MRRLFRTFTLGLCLAACQPAQEGDPVASVTVGRDGPATPATPAPGATIASQVESACRSVIFENTPLTDCIASPERHRISTALAGSDGNFGSMAAFAATRDARTIAFAVNAGMFEEGGDPVGYFVSGGERLKELNTAAGPGNFHMKPNGVFFGTGDRWKVRTAEDFRANVSERPQFGTQSGPMLVVDGRLHPEITQDGPSRTIRNAVGVDEQGRAHFVISSAPISFGKLARFYRDALKVKNALYLDGSVSQLWNPATDRIDQGAPIGPILVVERKVPDDE